MAGIVFRRTTRFDRLSRSRLPAKPARHEIQSVSRLQQLEMAEAVGGDTPAVQGAEKCGCQWQPGRSFARPIDHFFRYV